MPNKIKMYKINNKHNLMSYRAAVLLLSRRKFSMEPEK